MNQRAFNLFTALVSFILIGIATLLVLTMVQSESNTTHILQEIEEQARIEAILQTARSDAMQTVNFGIRSDIEQWMADPKNSIIPRPRDWEDWGRLKASFARSQFGSVCFCKKPMTLDLTLPDGTTTQYESQFASCDQMYRCQDGEGPNSDGSYPRNPSDEDFVQRANFSKRVAHHLQGLFQQWDIRYQGVLLRVEQTDNLAGLQNALEELMKLSLQPEGASTLDPDELAARAGATGILANEGFFDVVGCEKKVGDRLEMELNDQCIGTFYINLKGGAFAKRFPRLYEQLPVIVIEDTASGRVVKDPILPATDFRVYVPLRVFRALAIARRFAHDTEPGRINTARDQGFLSPRFHNELDGMALGLCDWGICMPRTNPYFAPAFAHANAATLAGATPGALACPGQFGSNAPDRQIQAVPLSFRGKDEGVYNPARQGGAEALARLIKKRVCELAAQRFIEKDPPVLSAQFMRVLATDFDAASAAALPWGGPCNAYPAEPVTDAAGNLTFKDIEVFKEKCCLLFNGFDDPATGKTTPYSQASPAYTSVFVKATPSKVLEKTARRAEIEDRLKLSSPTPDDYKAGEALTACAPDGLPEQDLALRFANALNTGRMPPLAGLQVNHRAGFWREPDGSAQGRGLFEPPARSNGKPLGAMGCSEDPDADPSASPQPRSVESLADQTPDASKAYCSELKEIELTLAVREENPAYMVNRDRGLAWPGLVYKIKLYNFDFAPFNPNFDQGTVYLPGPGAPAAAADFACEYQTGTAQKTDCAAYNFWGWTCMSLQENPSNPDRFEGCYPPSYQNNPARWGTP